MRRVIIVALGMVALAVTLRIDIFGRGTPAGPSVARTGAEVVPKTTATAPAAADSRAPASVDATTMALAETLKDDEIGRTLREGFALASSASTANHGALNTYLTKLDGRPDFAKKVVSDGLQRLPKDPAFADQRAGLIDLIPRFAHGDIEWASEQIESELTQFPSPPRPSSVTATSEAQLNEALSVTPDIARSQLAFETLLAVQTDCPALENAMTRIMSAQRDALLRDNFERRFKYTCPSSTLTF